MFDILGALFNGESKTIEFKERYSKTVLKTVSAFSNYHDGKIIIGITDKGIPIGVDDPKDLRLSIENTINDNIKPNPNFEIELKTVEIAKHEYDELVLLGRNMTYEELEYTGGELKFSKLKNLLLDKLGIVEVDEDILKSLELIQKGNYTNAAALVADRNLFKDIGMDFLCYADQSMLVFKDRINLNAVSIIEQFEIAMLFYNKHINKGDIIEGAYRESFEEVPQEAYREAVANAIIHRDYSKRGNNRVEIFDDRIEITSIGGLPVGISSEEYVNGNFSNARNRIIADLFLRCKIVEKMGTGVRRIKYAYKEYEEDPEFKLYENSIQVILPRVSIQDSHKKSEIKRQPLAAEGEKLLNYIKASEGIKRSEVEKFMNVGKTKATNLLNELVNKKYVIKVGVGKNTVYKIR